MFCNETQSASQLRIFREVIEMKLYSSIPMRRSQITLIALLLLATFAVSASMQQGGSFEIKPSVIAGGGGGGSNGNFRIDGTVGQGILGTSTGPGFSLDAGFWHGAADNAIAG